MFGFFKGNKGGGFPGFGGLGGFGGFNFQQLFQMAQEIQRELERIKNELENMEFEIEESGVKVIAKGSGDIVKVEILDDSLLSPENKEKLCEAIKTAANKALEKGRETVAQGLQKLAQKYGLDPNMLSNMQ